MFFFIYLLLRANLVSITYDEALTVLDYGRNPIGFINRITFTNNHLLNTWCIHVLLKFFGPHTFLFRLPNVAAGGLYVLFANRLFANLYRDHRKQLLGISAVLLHAFLVDFFSLARGYGLSMGFLMMSIYYSWRYIETKKYLLYGIISIMCTAVALLANYTLINFLAIQSGLFILHYSYTMYRTRPVNKIRIGIFIAFLTAMFFFVAWFLRIMFRLRSTGTFEFGGKNGFWHDTIGSLVQMNNFYAYAYKDPAKWILVILFAVIYLYASFLLIRQVFKKANDALFHFSILIFLLTTCCAIALVAEHILLGLEYAPDRATLYFLLLFPMFVSIVLMRNGSQRMVRLTALSIFLAIGAYSFFRSVNLKRTMMWSRNEGCEQLIGMLLDDSRAARSSGKDIQVAVDFDQVTVFNYITWSQGEQHINQAYWPSAGYESYADYYIAYKDSHDPPSCYQLMMSDVNNSLYKLKAGTVSFDTIMRPVQDFENTDHSRRDEGYRSSYAQIAGNDHTDCTVLSDTLTDTLKAGSRIEADAWIWSPEIFCRASIIADIVDADNRAVLWKMMNALKAPLKAQQWTKVSVSYIVDQDVLPGKRISAYLVNDDRKNIRVDDLHFYVLSVKAITPH